MVTQALFDFNHSRLGDALAGYTYPWEILPRLEAHIREVAATLSSEEFEQRDSDVWVARSARIWPGAVLVGPCIIDANAEVRPGAFVRGKVMVGRGAVVGNSTELKNALLFDGVQVPHYNYIGDSVLGYRVHFGAGAIASNMKSDRSTVTVHGAHEDFVTGLRKCGAMVGDFAEVGCGCVLNPGTVLGQRCRIYPLCAVRGTVAAASIVKNTGAVVAQWE